MGFGKREGSRELVSHCLKPDTPPSGEQHSGRSVLELARGDNA